MSAHDRTWIETLGKWSGLAFLVAGVLVSVGAIALGLVLVTDMSQGMITGLPTMVGFLIAYLGLLGLYPRLAAHRRRAALVGVILLLFPVLGIAFWLGHALIVGQEPWFANLLVGAVGGGFVVGLTLYGVTSYRTQVPSRGVGLALVVFAVTWVVLLWSGLVHSGVAPPWLDFVTASVRGALLLVIGYLMRGDSEPTDAEDPTPDLSA